MARYTESVCRLCRRENLKMYLKGDRCYTDKCAIERRPYPPGQHGQGRVKFSEYGVQLREKQKVKRMYGLLEADFRHAYFERRRGQGQDRREPAPDAGAPPRQRRLPPRLRRHAQRGAPAGPPRPLPRERPQGEHPLLPAASSATRSSCATARRRWCASTRPSRRSTAAACPAWLELDKGGFKGTVKTSPAREDITMPIQEQLIVELYSK